MPAIGAVFGASNCNRIEALQEAKTREESALRSLGDEVQKLGVALLRTLTASPSADEGRGQHAHAGGFEKLPEARRQHELGERACVTAWMGDFPRWR